MWIKRSPSGDNAAGGVVNEDEGPIALQLGALREALIDAGASPEKAA